MPSNSEIIRTPIGVMALEKETNTLYFVSPVGDEELLADGVPYISGGGTSNGIKALAVWLVTKDDEINGRMNGGALDAAAKAIKAIDPRADFKMSYEKKEDLPESITNLNW